MKKTHISAVLSDKNLDSDFRNIAQKIINKKRILFNEGVRLFDADLSFLGSLANYIRQEKHGDKTYFNRNIHIEPTNICVFDCKFCSYSRLLKHKQEGWEASEEDILKQGKRIQEPTYHRGSYSGWSSP